MDIHELANAKPTGPFKPTIEQLAALLDDVRARIAAERKEESRIEALLANARNVAAWADLTARGIKPGSLVEIGDGDGIRDIDGETRFVFVRLDNHDTNPFPILGKLKADGTPGKREVPEWRCASIRPSSLLPAT